GQRWQPRDMFQPIVNGIRIYMSLKGSVGRGGAAAGGSEAGAAGGAGGAATPGSGGVSGLSWGRPWGPPHHARDRSRRSRPVHGHPDCNTLYWRWPG
ncbi:MAG: hypothetical protein LAQ69_51665, partial [Acidobacteriia bacterium]|nr:hypothetical protein [Terriglobia bacterium]